MADKPRNPRRAADGPAKRNDPATRKGGPGGRPATAGRVAGKPEKGPARPRQVGGVDARTMETLEREGLLSAEGRKLMHGDGPEGPARAGARPRLKGGRTKFAGERPGSAGPVAKAGPGPVAKAGPGPVAKAGPGPVAKAGPGRGGKGPAHPGLTAAEEAVAERLHKVMAQAGVASRRHSEELIQAGRVTVNGKVVTELGTKVVPRKDRIEVDGRSLGRPENLVHLVLNKPKGYVTTLYDPQKRPKVTDLLGEEVAERVYPVGRLDFDTEGLLLLTNDGELANALMHPAKMVKKTYIAKVRGVPGPAKLKALEEGIELEDGVTAPADVKLVEAKGPNAATVSIRIHEGRNRQVRRMFEALGHEVIHLKRTTLGPLHLGDMPVGQWRELTGQELRDLRGVAGIAAPRSEMVANLTEQRKQRGGAPPRRGRVKGPRPFAGDGETAAERGPRTYGDRPARPARPHGPRPFEQAAGVKSLGAPQPAGGGKLAGGARPAARGRAAGGPKPAGGAKFGGPKSGGPKAAGGGFRERTGKGAVRKNRPPK